MQNNSPESPAGNFMSKEDEVRRLLLPDILGSPKALIDKDGDLVALTDFELPPNNYVFFIPVEKWKSYQTLNK